MLAGDSSVSKNPRQIRVEKREITDSGDSFARQGRNNRAGEPTAAARITGWSLPPLCLSRGLRKSRVFSKKTPRGSQHSIPMPMPLTRRSKPTNPPSHVAPERENQHMASPETETPAHVGTPTPRAPQILSSGSSVTLSVLAPLCLCHTVPVKSAYTKRPRTPNIPLTHAQYPLRAQFVARVCRRAGGGDVEVGGGDLCRAKSQPIPHTSFQNHG